MSDLSEIINQLRIMNTRDYWDIMGIIGPIILSFLIIVQSVLCTWAMYRLQKKIHNKDRMDRHHDDILRIYGSYYNFCDVICSSGFNHYVECGNANMVNAQINNLIPLRNLLNKNLDLAKLLFLKSNEIIYKKIDERITMANDIIDCYLEYYNDGEFYRTVNAAWDTITAGNDVANVNRGNYYYLSQNKEIADKFIMLCNTKKMQEIRHKLDKYIEMHTYEEFDKYFEEYISLS